MGGAIKIGEYLSSFGLDFFRQFDVALSFNLCSLEFALGVCMLLGVYRRFTTFLVLAFMCVMTPLTLYLALFNPVKDCGCFGDALVITNWETFGKNVILLAAAIVTFIYRKCIFPCFTYKVYWFVALYAYIFGIGFAYYNYNHLPMLNFRPYKTGANIIELTSVAPGAVPDEYEYSFIYEKNGEKKEFSLENYPADDTTWHFVDSKSKLIKEGAKPKITDFHLFSTDDEEVTESILHSERPVWLLILPDISNADQEQIENINDIFDYSSFHKMDFYGITGGSSEQIAKWIDETGAEYPFLKADETLLKTIIRSNPGLMLMQNGVIKGKWHYNDIPSEEDLKEVLQQISTSGTTKGKEDGLLLVNLLSFTVPLLLVWIYDFYRFRRKKKEKK